MPANTPVSAHILVVDDDRLVLVALSLGLQHAGYRVSTADSAEEAEHLLAAGIRPDLALLDIRMPGTSGLELAQRLHLFDHIPFVMLSAYSDATTVEHASTCGALSYLVKPIDLTQLSPAIATALTRASELRNLNRELQQLQKILDGERNISVAVGITMIQRQLGRDGAFNALRSAARAQRVKLVHVATEVIAVHENHCSVGVATEN